jgi:hypothetical protein
MRMGRVTPMWLGLALGSAQFEPFLPLGERLPALADELLDEPPAAPAAELLVLELPKVKLGMGVPA